MPIYVVVDPRADERERRPVAVEAEFGRAAVAKVQLDDRTAFRKTIPRAWKPGRARLFYRVMEKDGGSKPMWAYGPF